MTLLGDYVLPTIGLDGTPGGLSPNGRRLVLQAVPAAEELQRFASEGRRRSRFAVVDTSLAEPPQMVELVGNFSFDALSDDGSSLYVIEHMTATSPGPYQVRVYDLRANVLEEQIVAAKGEALQMDGARLSAVASTDGTWLYSLYLNSTDGPFVHALNVDTRFAMCIFLPTTGKADREKQLFWSLALSNDGRDLYAANGALGIVAEVSSTEFRVTRTATLPAPAASGDMLEHVARRLVPAARAKGMPAGDAALSPDGKILFMPGVMGVVAVDTVDFAVRGRYLDDRPVQHVAVSPDGERLYVASPAWSMLVQLDAATGATVAETTYEHVPLRVLRVETRP